MRSVVEESRSDRSNQDLGVIGAVAVWCECLHGKGILQNSLEQIAISVGAEAIALTRVSRSTGGQSRSLIFDRCSGDQTARKLERSYAKCLLGRYFASPKVGTIWYNSAIEGEADPALENFLRRRKLFELVAIPLAVEEKFVDFLEIHFVYHLSEAQQNILNILATTMARTWAHRATGLFSESILQRPKTGRETLDHEPILSFANPAQLSRAEYRVCLLCGRGFSAKAVQNELTISASTLRSHLRNIYAKTGTTCQSELVYRLFARALPLANRVASATN